MRTARCPSNAFELLVATILSAQCTDERSILSANLFRKYQGGGLSEGRDTELQQDIEAGYRNRLNPSGRVQGSNRRIQGEVPRTMEELLKLHWRARRLTWCSAWLMESRGIVVDTHVSRPSHRLGSQTKRRGQIEKDSIWCRRRIGSSSRTCSFFMGEEFVSAPAAVRNVWSRSFVRRRC